MIKKIPASNLKSGMYIHDLNCGWMSHPFLQKRFLIKDESRIEKIIDAGISEVYIDTNLGDDIDQQVSHGQIQSLEEVEQSIDSEIEKLTATPDTPQPPTPLQEELNVAQRLNQEAREMTKRVLDRVAQGEPIETEPVETVARPLLR
ncbi:DUF3391 domain-containing protein [Candidatus Reidiella endopervernicosa]|uniref:DUF3391 domain-containing protein n=1 Tax=Candidatus Reidiella endopervernicosa TaxID=2738883 RepID=A0A6N0HYQ9_9GAMM|nr:DUF3391 domain-containing protein [Candidatus Reidiella endopervernicosa]QKQ27492.1 DUF3391 domain-containing protein [Candidatus Reidiella endopervernicosa]